MKKFLFLTVFTFFTISSHSQTFNFSSNNISLLVKEIDKSAAFYSEILQLKEIETPEGFPDTVRWFALSDATQIRLTQTNDKFKTPSKGVHFSMATDALLDFVNLLVTKNIPFEDIWGKKTKTSTRSDGVKVLYIQDIDGYWIEITTKK